MIFLNGLILPIGGIAQGKVCAHPAQYKAPPSTSILGDNIFLTIPCEWEQEHHFRTSHQLRIIISCVKGSFSNKVTI